MCYYLPDRRSCCGQTDKRQPKVEDLLRGGRSWAQVYPESGGILLRFSLQPRRSQCWLRLFIVLLAWKTKRAHQRSQQHPKTPFHNDCSAEVCSRSPALVGLFRPTHVGGGNRPPGEGGMLVRCVCACLSWTNYQQHTAAKGAWILAKYSREAPAFLQQPFGSWRHLVLRTLYICHTKSCGPKTSSCVTSRLQNVLGFFKDCWIKWWIKSG